LPPQQPSSNSKPTFLPAIVPKEKPKGDLHLVQPLKVFEKKAPKPDQSRGLPKSTKLLQQTIELSQPVKLTARRQIPEPCSILPKQDPNWKPTVRLKSSRKSKKQDNRPEAKLLAHKPPHPSRFKSKEEAEMNRIFHDARMSGILDEKILAELLSNAQSRQQALHYIDKNVTSNSNMLALLDRSLLFEQFHRVLADYRSTNHQIQCTMLVSKLIPLLKQSEVDPCMKKIMTRVVCNIGSNQHKLQRESIQTVHQYMKRTQDFKYVVQSLAYDGLRHKDKKTRHQVLVSFPSLLFPEFKHQDFFDVVHTLVLGFDEEEGSEDNSTLRKVWKIVGDYLGAAQFNKCIERLPQPLQAFLAKRRIIPSSESRELLGVDSDTDISITPSKSIAWSPETVPPPKPRNNSVSLDERSPTGGEGKKLQRRHLRERDMEQVENTFGIPFLSKQNLIELASPISTIRLKAVEQVKRILESPEMNADKLTNCTFTLVSILQSTVRDKNLQIVSTSLSCLQVILRKVSFKMTPHLELFAATVITQMGNSNVSIRTQIAKILFQMCDLCGPQQVVEQMWRKHNMDGWMDLRSEVVDFITSVLLKYPQYNRKPPLDISRMCLRLARSLMDLNVSTRLACMECFAVIGWHIATSNMSNSIIAQAVNQIEVLHDEAEGLMGAVNARLVRKQMPKFNRTTLLMEYSKQPSYATADVIWVQQPNNPISQRTSQFSSQEDVFVPRDNSYSSRESNGVSRNSSFNKTDSAREKVLQGPGSPFKNSFNEGKPPLQGNSPQSRKSADLLRKQLSNKMFPWTSSNNHQDFSEALSSNNSSQHAPQIRSSHQSPSLRRQHHNNNNSDTNSTWATDMVGSKEFGQYKSSPQDLDSTLEYREMKRNILRNSSNQLLLSGAATPTNKQGRNSYMPSFAANDSSSSKITDSASSIHEAGSKFADSAPSAFFDSSKPLRSSSINRMSSINTQISQQVSNLSSGVASEAESRMIMTKPALARSASKHRKKPQEIISSESINSNGSQRPRNLNTMTSAEKFTSALTSPTASSKRGSTSKLLDDDASMTTSGYHSLATRNNRARDDKMTSSQSSYTPSAVLMKKSNSLNSIAGLSSQASIESAIEAQSSRMSKHAPSPSDTSPLQRNVTSKPVTVKSNMMSQSQQPSFFDSEMPHNASMASIRRSAQDKRARMLRSQPTSNDISNGVPSTRNKTHSAQSSFRSPTTSEKQSSSHSLIETNNNYHRKIDQSPTQPIINNRPPMHKRNSREELSISPKTSRSRQFTTTVANDNMKLVGVGINSDDPQEPQIINVKGRGVQYSNQFSPSNSKHRIRNQNSDELMNTWSPSTNKNFNKRANNRRSTLNKTDSFKNSMSVSGNNMLDSNSSFSDKDLQQALTQMETTDNELWKQIASSMKQVQSICENNSPVVVNRYSNVVRLLSKQVSNLRSQVSRVAVSTLCSLYTNISKPTSDIDLEFPLKALVIEYGKTNVFMREEIDKTLEAMLYSCSYRKIFNTLLDIGAKHKNKDIRSACSNYVSKLVCERIKNVDRIYTKDFQQRLFECTSQFIVDSHQDVRYHGRCIVNQLISTEDGLVKFRRACDNLLDTNQQSAMNKCAHQIKERGLKSAHIGGKRASMRESRNNSSRRDSSGRTSYINQQSTEDLKDILSRVNKGDFQSKKEAFNDLLTKFQKNINSFNEDSFKKVLEVFSTLLTTSNSKANLLALENFNVLMQAHTSVWKETSINNIIPPLLKLTVSKYHNLAKQVVESICSKIDANILLGPFCNQAKFAQGKARKYAFDKLTALLPRVTSQSMLERHVFKVLFDVMMTSSSNLIVSKEAGRLACQLVRVGGDSLKSKLVSEAETRNVSSALKKFLANSS